jgi:hypothetical protein
MGVSVEMDRGEGARGSILDDAAVSSVVGATVLITSGARCQRGETARDQPTRAARALG